MAAKRLSTIKFVLQRKIHMTQESNHISLEAAPRPLRKVIGELPSQYLKVLTRPSKETFVREMDKASWSCVWIQLLVLVLITSLIGWLGSLILSPFNTRTFFGRLSMLIIQPYVGISAGNLIFNPIRVLIGVPLDSCLL
jgi:ABC-type transporter Mla maintaining outer membrane lipid asymmetry permease subunit MlaE